MTGNQRSPDGVGGVLARELLGNAEFLAAIGVGLVVQDASGSILEVNDTACELVGMSRALLLGSKSFLPPPHESDASDNDSDSEANTGTNRRRRRHRHRQHNNNEHIDTTSSQHIHHNQQASNAYQ